MATMTKTAARTPKATKTETGFPPVKLPGGFYATPTGLRKGSRGRVVPAVTAFSQLPKGERRQLRKALYRAGLVRFAAAR